MGFKKLINGEAFLNTFKNIQQVKNSKKTLSLFAALTLLGISQVMAQSTGATAVDGSTVDKGVMWSNVGFYVILFVIGCLGVAIFGKVLKVYDISQKMRGKKGLNWNGFMGVVCLLFLVAGVIGSVWSFVVQGSMSLPEAASEHGVAIDNMFSLTTVLTMIVFFITQILLFGFAFVYRHSEKRKGYYYPHNNTIEKIWTVIPAIVLTVLVIFGFFTWQRVMDYTEGKNDINIDVTGHQFAWELRYTGPDGKLGKIDFKKIDAYNKLGIDYTDRNSFDDLQADTLVMPVNRWIRLNIHAQDVIHSVYLPHFRVQLNAVPGLPTFFRFKPTITTEEMRNKTHNPDFEYSLYCNKICGSSHYNMQKVVRVVSQAQYNEWIAKQKPYLTDKLKQDLKMVSAPAAAAPSSVNTMALNK